MRWASFLLISASLHALILTLPLTPSLQRDGHAIPVTLLIAKDGSRQEPTPERISMTSKKSVRPPVASKRQAPLEQTESRAPRAYARDTLHTLRRAQPSEANPPAPRLRRIPSSHSSTGLHPRLSAKEGRKNTEALALIKRTEKAAQLKKPKAVYEKKPQKKAFVKRSAADPTMTNVSEPASTPTEQKSASSKPNRQGKVQKAPATPSPDPSNSSPADTSDEIIVKKYNSQENEIAKLKVSAAINEKKPQIKAFAKRSAADPTMINVSEPASIPTDQKSVVSNPNRQGKDQTVLSTPRPGPTISSPADTGSETIVEEDNSHEAEAAVEMSALLEDSGEADISETENLIRETIGTEAIEERFSNAVAKKTTIALRSRQEGDGSRVFKPAGLTHRISPKYPERARRKGWEGTTLLRVLIDRRGKSKAIQVSQSSGFAALDRAAVKAVKQWRFYPAHNGNGPVESWVRVPIIFRLVRDQN